MDGCTTSSVDHANHWWVIDDDFIEGVADDMHNSNDQQVFRTHPSHDSSESDQHGCNSIGAFDEGEDVNLDEGIIPSSVENSVPETLQEDVELCNDCVDEEGVRNGAPGVWPDEGHQVAKADEHHDIDVLPPRVSLRDESCIVYEFDLGEDPEESDQGHLDDKHGPTKGVEGVFLDVLLFFFFMVVGHNLTRGVCSRFTCVEVIRWHKFYFN